MWVAFLLNIAGYDELNCRTKLPQGTDGLNVLYKVNAAMFQDLSEPPETTE